MLFFDAYRMYKKKYWAQERPILCELQSVLMFFDMLTTCTQKKYWAQEQRILRKLQMCSEVCLFFMTVENEGNTYTHILYIYIYMMFMHFVKLKFTDEDV